MKLNFLSTCVLAALVAIAAVGCKKKMDRVTPLPGYGASTVGDNKPDGRDRINTPPIDISANPRGNNGGITTDPNMKPSAEGNIPLSDKRSIEGRQQDREKYRNQTVHFDFDRSTIRASEASKVQEVATRFKNEDPATDLLIEGHCDERGTEGYNQALGERRALALREMLVSLGVPAERIHTVSFGKDRPADPGHSESAWSQNRRGEFILVLAK